MDQRIPPKSNSNKSYLILTVQVGIVVNVIMRYLLQIVEDESAFISVGWTVPSIYVWYNIKLVIQVELKCQWFGPHLLVLETATILDTHRSKHKCISDPMLFCQHKLMTPADITL